jgi:hypothetical protein
LNITRDGRFLPDWDDDDKEFMTHAALAMLTILIGFFIIEAVASLFLIQGASNNKRLYLVPWLLERAVHLIYQMVIWLSLGVFMFTSEQSMQNSVFTFIIGGLVICKFFYKYNNIYLIHFDRRLSTKTHKVMS